MKNGHWFLAVLLSNILGVAGWSSANGSPQAMAQADFSEGSRCPLCELQPSPQ